MALPIFNPETPPSASGPLPGANRSLDDTVPVRPSAAVPDHGIGPLPQTGFFGRYELLGEARAGGMGAVYKARDLLLKRVVAVKLLRTGALAGADEVGRFYREAQAVAQLRHPHIVPIYDIDRQDGLDYFTMEYVGGGSLAEHLPRLQQDPRAAVVLIEKIARAVQAAHASGILHRDLKPGNILLDEAGEPRVSDFGLAKFFDAGRQAPPNGPEAAPAKIPAPSGDLTPTDSSPADLATPTVGTLGTPSYMSPEQAAGQAATSASDLWALGVLLYELLTGKRPFQAPTRAGLLNLIRTGEPARPRKVCPAINAKLEAVCLKCLEKDPARRYASAGALADDLGNWLRPGGRTARLWRRVRRHPWRTAAATLLGLATLFAAVALALPDPDRPLKVIQHELRRGQAVTLIGETGSPLWKLPLIGDFRVADSTYKDGTFCLEGQGQAACVLQLVPAVGGKGYRLSAEVRQEDGGHNSQAGLLFAHTQQPTVLGLEHCFCTLEFCDTQPLFEDPVRKVRSRRVALGIHRYYEPGQHHATTADVIKYFDPAPNPGAAGPPSVWRKLAVEVRPEGIQAFWEGESVGSVTQAELQRRFRWLKRTELLWDESPQLNPAFTPDGGIGLFTTGGWVAYRRVRVEPLK